MTLHIVRRHPTRCPECEHERDRTVTVAADAAERPDLVTRWAGGDGLYERCGRCDALYERDEPLCVLRLAEAAPLLLAVPETDLRAEAGGFARSEPLLAEVEELQAAEDLGVPGPVLLLPFDVLVLAARRDLDEDVLDPEAAVAEVESVAAEAGTRYGMLLDDIAATASERRLQVALTGLMSVTDARAYQQLVDEYPELVSDRALEIAKERVDVSTTDDERQAFEGKLELLRASRDGVVAEAWGAYERSLLSFYRDHVSPQLDRLLAEFEQATDEATTIRVGDELIELARSMGHDELEAEASLDTAGAIMESLPDGELASVRRAIALLERARALYGANPAFGDANLRRRVAHDLGVTFAQRPEGDPIANQLRAIELFASALEDLSLESNGRVWATVLTNRGHSRLELERLQSREDTEAEDAQRREAIDLAIADFEDALRWRSFERDPNDWAYTMVNLGLAYQRRGGDSDAELPKAIAAYEDGARGFAAVGKEQRQARALANGGFARHELAQRRDTNASDRHELIDAGVDAIGRAISLQQQGPVVELGRSWNQMSEVLLAHRGYGREVVAAHREAMARLTAQTASRDARQVSRRLAQAASEAGDWQVAAEAYEHCVEAASAAVRARSTRRGRFEEIRENLNLWRWAAYALTRAGRPERAIEVIELGRAGELNAWLGRDLIDLDELQRLDPALHDRFVALRKRLERADRGAGEGALGDAEAAETFALALEEVRALPGFETTLALPSFTDVVAGLEADRVIAYPVTAPSGSVWLLASNGREGPNVEALDLPALTSGQVVPPLINVKPGETEPSGYLPAQGRGNAAEIDEALRELSELLGPGLMRPLADNVRARYGGVTIVAMGLLGYVPLHALTWDDAGTAACLLDAAAVSYTASGYAHAICRERARRPHDQSLLAVGNPLPHPDPLPGAEREAQEVADLFEGASRVLLRRDATRERVLEAVEGRAYLHFACHGEAATLSSQFDAALKLAGNEPVTAEEVLALPLEAARLVVASACETGVITGYEEADEALSLATAFIGAGAAGVVSTLWQVNDEATAALMAHFYELLSQNTVGPEEALRRAQLWLRDQYLGAEDETPSLWAGFSIAGA